MAGDEALTTAILDRLLHYAHVINIRGEVTGPRTDLGPEAGSVSKTKEIR